MVLVTAIFLTLSKVNHNRGVYMSTTATTEDKIAQFRISEFERLGFSTEQAKKLSEAKMTVDVKTKAGVKVYEQPLSWRRASYVLSKGCPNDLAMKILL